MLATKRILIADEIASHRESISESLRTEGYEVECVKDGLAAWASIERQVPALMILDVCLPYIDGLKLVEAIRAAGTCPDLPILIVSSTGGKEEVVRAKKLGVQGYLLKSAFSMPALLARVNQICAPKPEIPLAPQIPAPEIIAMIPMPDSEPLIGSPETIGRVETLDRIDRLSAGCMLTGIVKQIVSIARDDDSTLADVVQLLKKDPLLATRVIHIAKSPELTARKVSTYSLEEVVRHIGSRGVLKCAMSKPLVRNFPSAHGDGFNAARCWQHSVATAMLMERLTANQPIAAETNSYMIGLCHDLPVLVLRALFEDELIGARICATANRVSMLSVESRMFGMSRQELYSEILGRCGLPSSIADPIVEFHCGDATRILPRILRLANEFANAMQLTTGIAEDIAPWPTTEIRSLLSEHIPEIDAVAIQQEVLNTTARLSMWSESDQAKLSQPLYPRSEERIWYARNNGLSPVDPIAAALQTVSKVTLQDRLPLPHELSEIDGIIIAIARSTAARFSLEDAVTACGATPTLYLWGGDGAEPTWTLPATMSKKHHPIRLADLVAFVNRPAEAAAIAA